MTLSACETALGREASGEGLLGLVWAFHFAGARSVLGSLWRVEDTATAVVMRRFYRGIAAGLPKHRALREAQLGLIRSGDRETSGPERGVGGLTGEGVPAASHPFLWASFQLSGD